MAARDFKSLDRLFEIMQRLRKDCPWDKGQSFESLITHSIEEIYELADAVYNKNKENIKEELGDLWMHLVFYTLIAEEEKLFSLDEILKKINDKLIFRHPHIFQEGKSLTTAKEVLEQWQKMKKQEGKTFALSGVSKALPAISKALRIQQKASDNKFDFENINQVKEKYDEEQLELQQAINENSNIEEEFGDVLFSLINYARFLNLDPEKALQLANQKFINRFTAMEKMTMQEGENFVALSNVEKENLWKSAKENLK